MHGVWSVFRELAKETRLRRQDGKSENQGYLPLCDTLDDMIRLGHSIDITIDITAIVN